jgi:hypothetical protein
MESLSLNEFSCSLMSYGATTRITTCDCHDKMYSIGRHSLRNHNPSSMVWSTRLRTSQCLLLKTADSCQTFRVRLGALERIVANRTTSLYREHMFYRSRQYRFHDCCVHTHPSFLTPRDPCAGPSAFVCGSNSQGESVTLLIRVLISYLSSTSYYKPLAFSAHRVQQRHHVGTPTTTEHVTQRFDGGSTSPIGSLKGLSG